MWSGNSQFPSSQRLRLHTSTTSSDLWLGTLCVPALNLTIWHLPYLTRVTYEVMVVCWKMRFGRLSWPCFRRPCWKPIPLISCMIWGTCNRSLSGWFVTFNRYRGNTISLILGRFATHLQMKGWGNYLKICFVFLSFFSWCRYIDYPNLWGRVLILHVGN